MSKLTDDDSELMADAAQRDQMLLYAWGMRLAGLALSDDDSEAQAETSEHIARLAGPVDLGFPAPGYMRPASSDQSDDSGTPAQAEET